MKKNFIFIFIFLFITINSGYSYLGFFKLRSYGSLGYTGGNSVNVGDGSLINYRVGVQPMYQVSRYASFGFDIGYLHGYTADYATPCTKESNGCTSYNNADFLHSLFLFDTSFARNVFILQLGVGAYYGIGDNSDRVDPGFMIGTGIDFPITDKISIPAIMRYEVIISERTLVPLNVLVGITYKFRASKRKTLYPPLK